MRRFLAILAVLVSSFAVCSVAVASPAAPQPVKAPVINGEQPGNRGTVSLIVGATLSSSQGQWGNGVTSVAYQWQRCTSQTLTTCSNISGATSSTYTLVTGDIGDYVRVGVTATNTHGTAASPQYSVLTPLIASNLPVNTLVPALSGATVQGSVVSLVPGTFTNETTQTGVYQICTDLTHTTCTGSSTGASYTIQGTDSVGSYVFLKETATNTHGNTVVWSNGVGPITASSTTGYQGTCTTTINPSASVTVVSAAEATMTAGQVLCLNSGTYSTTTTVAGCVGTNNNTCSGANYTVLTKGGGNGTPIIITAGPGQTVNLKGGIDFRASNITLENMNIDASNSLSPASGGGAAPIPPCTNTPRMSAIEVADGFVSTNITIQNNNIYASIPSVRSILIFIGAGGSSGMVIQHNNISNGGSCGQTQHLIYDDAGTNGTISGNWFWSDQNGYAVQMYPSPSTTTVSSNVIDGTLDGFVDDSSGGGNTISHNVVINPVTANAITTYNTQSIGGQGAFQSCFHDQSGATDTQANNAIYNATNGFGCTSETGVTISGQTTLGANPFVSSTTRNYGLCASGNSACTSGQITAAGQLASYALWNGSGPPVPNPATSLASVTKPVPALVALPGTVVTPCRAYAPDYCPAVNEPSNDVPTWIVVLAVFAVVLLPAAAIVRRKRP